MSKDSGKSEEYLEHWHELSLPADICEGMTVKIHGIDPLKRWCIPPGYRLAGRSISAPETAFSRAKLPQNTAEWDQLSLQEQLLARLVERVMETVPKTSLDLPTGGVSNELQRVVSQMDELFGMITRWTEAAEEHEAEEEEEEEGAQMTEIQHVVVDAAVALDATSLVNSVCFSPQAQELLLPNGLTVVLPAQSAFCWANLQSFPLSRLASSVGKQRLIVADPPWFNRSVRRAKKYAAMTNEQLLRMDVGTLADPSGCVLALWVTNDPMAVAFALNQLLPCWGFEFVEEWLWVKVAANGELITSVTSKHKKPYERLLLARFKGSHRGQGEDVDKDTLPLPNAKRRRWQRDHPAVASASEPKPPPSDTTNVPTNIFICPSLRHSMKPAIERHLVEWTEEQLLVHIGSTTSKSETVQQRQQRQLVATELFARELKEGFISVGNQPLLFQVKDTFLALASETSL